MPANRNFLLELGLLMETKSMHEQQTKDQL